MTVQIPPLWTNESTTEWVDALIADYITQYRRTGHPQRVDFRDLCASWSWAKRSDVYTHFLHRYPAKLLPYIPIFFLSSSLVSSDDTILDPFAGTGTVGLESITHPVRPRNCQLIEFSPLARLISSVKTTPIDPAVLRKRFASLSRLMREYDKEPTIPQFPRIDFWFRKKAQTGLAKVRDCIKALDADVTEKDFFWACYSSIIRDMSRADPKVAPPVLLSAKKFPGARQATVKKKLAQKQRFEAPTLFRKAVKRNIDRMQELWTVLNYTGGKKTSWVVGHDARNLTYAPYTGKGRLDTAQSRPLTDNSIGMVITSPPYINAQKYARTTKFELWWLELIEESEESLADFARQLIGTERVLHDEYVELTPVENATADALLQWIFDIKPRRAGIVSQYFRDMRLALKEIKRVLRPEGYCILVIGNNVIFKRVMPNNQILAEIAQEEGFELKAMLVDEIRSRGLITKRHETAGMIADEWIILLHKPASYH
jgi:hypothetical protein